MRLKSSTGNSARGLGSHKAICMVLSALLAVTFSSLAARTYLWKARGSRGFLIVSDLSSCRGFGEYRQTFLHALSAAQRSDRCLVLPGFLSETSLDTFTNDWFDAARLSYCAKEMQTCLYPASKEVTADALPAIQNFRQLMLANVSQVTWSCRKILLAPDADQQEAMLWKAAQCLDSSYTLGLGDAAKIIHAALDDSYNMILGAFDIVKADGQPATSACQGLRCEMILSPTNLAYHLKRKGIVPGTQLIISDDVDFDSEEQLASLLAPLGYEVVQWHRLMVDYEFAPHLHLELLYIAGQRCQKLLTNTDRNGNALLYLQRQHGQSWASSSSFKQIPLAQTVPFFRLPWVFTYNSWSTKYDYMLKASVRSAMLKAPLLRPICLFSGDPRNAKLYSWLLSQHVKIIHHDPAWKDAFTEKLKGTNNLRHSHLYATADMQIGTWQRIDIPILAELAEYNFCLFTDSDVYFRASVSLQDFGSPLPSVLGMGYERENQFPPLNAGVMVMNLPSLSSSYDQFLKHVLQNEHGLFWPGYGPGDQGAINHFYEAAIRPHRLDSRFNTKPYHAWKEAAKIVHFHGPKPHDFLNYMQTGDCKFRDYCQTGLSNGFCMYAAEWASYIRDEPLGQQVSSACLVYHAANVGTQHLAGQVQGRLQEPSLNEEILTTLQDLGLDPFL